MSPEMLVVRDDLAPMLSQYADLCEDRGDVVVLFQVGDFYEAFCDTAEAVVHTCEVTLTQREDSTGTWPMMGVPIDNAVGYLERLLDAGYRITFTEQVEDAGGASGLVDRAVTRLIMPGTVVDEELLDVRRAAYLEVVTRGGGNVKTRDSDSDADTYGFVVVDVSTGECPATGTDRVLALEELERLALTELVVDPDCDLPDLPFDPMETSFEPEVFDTDAACETLSVHAPQPDAVVESTAEFRAVGAVFAYAKYAQGDSQLAYVTHVMRFDPRELLQLDTTAIRSLELFESQSVRAGSTLPPVPDEMVYALGRHQLEAWFCRPFIDRDRTEVRPDAVEALLGDALVRADLRDHLSSVYGLEQLAICVSCERVDARDLCSPKTTSDRVPEIRDALVGTDSDLLSDLRDSLDELEDICDLVSGAIASDPLQETTEGGVITDDFNAELDDVRGTAEAGRGWVSNPEAHEQEYTGTDSLEVGYNRVHGHYIEMTNPNLDRAFDDYQRRQTSKSSERFYMPELREREDEILRALDRTGVLEYNPFREIHTDVVIESARVQAVADALADPDMLQTFTDVVVTDDYVRPELHAGDTNESAGIHIDAGKHPVAERAQDEFVPNPVDLP